MTVTDQRLRDQHGGLRGDPVDALRRAARVAAAIVREVRLASEVCVRPARPRSDERSLSRMRRVGVGMRLAPTRSDHFIRWLRVVALVLLAISALMLLISMVLTSVLPPLVWAIAVLGMVSALVLHLVVLLDRIWRRLRGLPRRDLSLFVINTTYACPKCGYLLRGVHGPMCPECGEVRPAPIDGDSFE